MKKNLFILLVTFGVYTTAFSQQVMTPKAVIDSVLRTINNFQTDEYKKDSIAGHPLGSSKEEDFLRRFRFYDSVNNILNVIRHDSLQLGDEINLELLQYSFAEEIENYKYKAYLNPILSDEGFHTTLAFMSREVLTDAKSADDYINKLRDIPRYINENLELMRRGLSMGISQPGSILEGYKNTYKQHIVTDADKSTFYKPFAQKPFGITDTAWKRIHAEGKTVIMQYAVEGFRRMKDFFDTGYLPHTRKSLGLSNFPDGVAYYQSRVKHYTTTDISYGEVYELGIREVSRIKKGDACSSEDGKI